MPSQGKTAELAGGAVTNWHASLLDAGAKEILQALGTWKFGIWGLGLPVGWLWGQGSQHREQAWCEGHTSLAPGPKPGPASWQILNVLP